MAGGTLKLAPNLANFVRVRIAECGQALSSTRAVRVSVIPSLRFGGGRGFCHGDAAALLVPLMVPQFAVVPAEWFVDSPLTPSQRLTLCALCFFKDKATGECWPSITTLAHVSGLSRPTVLKSLKVLAALGVIRIEKRKRQTSRYTVLHRVTVMVKPLDHSGKTGSDSVVKPLAPNRVVQNRPKNSDAPRLAPKGASGRSPDVVQDDGYIASTQTYAQPSKRIPSPFAS